MERKGVTPALARAIMRTNTTAIGAIMVKRGEADSFDLWYVWTVFMAPKIYRGNFSCG